MRGCSRETSVLEKRGVEVDASAPSKLRRVRPENAMTKVYPAKVYCSLHGLFRWLRNFRNFRFGTSNGRFGRTDGSCATRQWAPAETSPIEKAAVQVAPGPPPEMTETRRETEGPRKLRAGSFTVTEPGT